MGWGFGRGVGAWGGGALVWERDRGEHYLLRPLSLAGINVLGIDSLLFMSLFQSLCLFRLRFRFPLSGFFSLDSLRVALTRLPGRRYKPTVCVLP
jgi:hypothetical protein